MVDTGEGPSSRPPRRNEELWYAGSYRELESAVDALPRPQRRAFHAEHLDCRDPFKSTEAAALLEVVARMPHSFYVPTEISEAAGYLPSEAKVYSR